MIFFMFEPKYLLSTFESENAFKGFIEINKVYRPFYLITLLSLKVDEMMSGS